MSAPSHDSAGAGRSGSGAAGDAGRSDFDKAWYSRFVQFATLREDDAGIAGWSQTGLETRFRFFRKLWKQPKAGARFVDVGCGAGTYSRWLADRDVHVTGIDYSHVAVSKAMRRDGVHVDYCVADANSLPVRTASVDGALCFGVLQAVSSSQRVVAELARIVRPGGEVWIDALNRAHPAARWDRLKRRLRGKPMHLRYESASALRDIMLASGFEQVARHWLIILPHRLYWAHSLAESGAIRWTMRVLPGLGPLLGYSVLLHAVRRRD